MALLFKLGNLTSAVSKAIERQLQCVCVCVLIKSAASCQGE